MFKEGTWNFSWKWDASGCNRTKRIKRSKRGSKKPLIVGGKEKQAHWRIHKRNCTSSCIITGFLFLAFTLDLQRWDTKMDSFIKVLKTVVVDFWYISHLGNILSAYLHIFVTYDMLLFFPLSWYSKILSIVLWFSLYVKTFPNSI